MQMATPRVQIEEFRNYLAEDPANRIILNIDMQSIGDLRHVDRNVIQRVGMVKIGHELNVSASWLTAIRALFARNVRGVFLDTRYSENPFQIGESVRSLATTLSGHVHTGVPKMLSVDVAKADEEGLRNAVAARRSFMVIGETIQPSTPHDECVRKYKRSPKNVVRTLAQIAAENGLQGITASPFEMEVVASDPNTCDLLRIATGIREPGEPHDDQRRVHTTRTAFLNGAEMVSIGRSVLNLPYENQLDKIESIIDSIDKAIGI